MGRGYSGLYRGDPQVLSWLLAASLEGGVPVRLPVRSAIC